MLQIFDTKAIEKQHLKLLITSLEVEAVKAQVQHTMSEFKYENLKCWFKDYNTLNDAFEKVKAAHQNKQNHIQSLIKTLSSHASRL